LGGHAEMPAREPSVLETASRFTREIRNWYSAGLLAALVLPSRVPPQRGLSNTWFGRRVVRFHLREGYRVECRLQDSAPVMDVSVKGDYDLLSGIDWNSIRTIIDVGAHVGSFTVWASHRAIHAQVVAVEPNPEVWPFLVANVNRNDLRERVLALQLAVGEREGSAFIAVNEQSGEARVVPGDDGSRPMVRVTTLRNLMLDETLSAVDLVKLDCEGAEYGILLSAPTEVLQRINALVCEYHPVVGHHVSELVGVLKDAGFQVRVQPRRNDIELGTLLAHRG